MKLISGSIIPTLFNCLIDFSFILYKRLIFFFFSASLSQDPALSFAVCFCDQNTVTSSFRLDRGFGLREVSSAEGAGQRSEWEGGWVRKNSVTHSCDPMSRVHGYNHPVTCTAIRMWSVEPKTEQSRVWFLLLSYEAVSPKFSSMLESPGAFPEGFLHLLPPPQSLE